MTLSTSEPGRVIRPTLIIDIDGVINPLKSKDLSNYSKVDTPWATFFLSDLIHGTWLRQLHRNGIRIMFSSLMIEEIPDIAKFYRIPEYEVFNIENRVQQNDFNYDTWKIPSVKRYAENELYGSPIVWVDDELFFDAMTWATTRKNTYIISPNQNDGLMSNEIKDITEYFHEASR